MGSSGLLSGQLRSSPWSNGRPLRTTYGLVWTRLCGSLSLHGPLRGPVWFSGPAVRSVPVWPGWPLEGLYLGLWVYCFAVAPEVHYSPHWVTVDPCGVLRSGVRLAADPVVPQWLGARTLPSKRCQSVARRRLLMPVSVCLSVCLCVCLCRASLCRGSRGRGLGVLGSGRAEAESEIGVWGIGPPPPLASRILRAATAVYSLASM